MNSDYNGCADIPRKRIRKSHKSRAYDIYGDMPPEDIVRPQLSLPAPAWTLDGPPEMSAEYDGGKSLISCCRMHTNKTLLQLKSLCYQIFLK